MMEEKGFDFVFTGEVVGERPMSQRRDTMRIIERESGLAGRLLRPLSAQLLPPTVPEQEGLVDREKLMAISGRSRSAAAEQTALVTDRSPLSRGPLRPPSSHNGEGQVRRLRHSPLPLLHAPVLGGVTASGS